ncbi:MAG: PD-(D/E)XK nuclease family protein [Rugosibacter sp.]|nr:PD-(D/E)XK nuclease family protein [Rugosibacter sp.]
MSNENLADLHLHNLVTIVQSPKAMRLAAELRWFSPFDVLKVGHYELRHVNTLAWLLDPNQNHGLNESFLRAFLNKFVPSFSEGSYEISVPELFETSADRTVVVRREVNETYLKKGLTVGAQEEDEHGGSQPQRRSLDLLIDGGTWAVAIEAKINSSEGQDQLASYGSMLERWRGTRSLLMLFLVVDPNTDQPSQPEWKTASWSENVIDPLEQVINARDYSSVFNSPQIQFIQAYIRNLQRYATTEEGSVAQLAGEIATDYSSQLSGQTGLKKYLSEQLSKSDHSQGDDTTHAIERLYFRHKEILDYVLDAVDSDTANRAKVLRTVLQDRGYTVLGTTSAWIRFLPSKWSLNKKYQQLLLKQDSSSDMLIGFSLSNRPEQLSLALAINDLGDHAKDQWVHARRELATTICTNGELQPVFPGAFYRNRLNSGGTPVARPFSNRYFSILTKSGKLGPSNTAKDLLNKFLDQLKDDHVVETFEQLLKQVIQNYDGQSISNKE